MRDPGISLNHCIFDVFHELTAGGKPSTWLPPGELVKPQPDDTLCECAALDCPQINFRNSNKLFHFEKKYRFFNSKFMIFMIRDELADPTPNYLINLDCYSGNPHRI